MSSSSPPPAPAPAPRRPARTRSLEDRLGGQVLAWVGGAAVLLGIVFFLVLAPVLAGAPSDGATIALVLAAGAAAAGLLVWQRWDWLALATFAATAPQWWMWLTHHPSPSTAVVVLSAFGAVTVATAIGFELRCRAVRLRGSSAFLLAANALALAAGGWMTLVGTHPGAAHLWLAGLAIAHAAVGLGSGRGHRVSPEIRAEALVLAVLLGDVAFAVLADGPLLTVGWPASAVAFAVLARAVERRGADHRLVLLGLGGHVALALGHALAIEATPGGPLHGARPVLSLVALAAACLTSARVAHGGVRQALDVLGLAVTAYLAADTLDGAALAATWAVEAVALGTIARRTRDDVAAGAPALGGRAGAPLPRLVRGGHPVPAGQLRHAGRPRARRAPAGPGTAQRPLGLCGLGALIAGLARGLPALRRGALALLLVAIGKVFLWNLSTLESVYRAASFVALGLLLLAGAFAWQRMRPAVAAESRA